MKLLEILVQELPERGGWPDFAEKVHQDYDGDLWKWHGDDVNKVCTMKVIADNHRKFSENESHNLFVTREQYEAALAASRPEWDGVGEPPVGNMCEFREKGKTGWSEGIVGVVNYKSPFTVVLSGDNCEHVHHPINLDFRPIRSEADKKRDDVTQSILDVLNDYDFEMVHIRSDQKHIATDIVERIASGMIPHTRID